MPEKLLVFIPCYNCAAQIPRVLRQFKDARTAGLFSQVLVLDNNSTDGTVNAAMAAAQECPAVPVVIGRNRANFNLGGSHKAAFQYAVANGFSHVVVLHGDDQGSIQDLLPVLASGRHRSMDACLGARFMPGSALKGYSAFRTFGNRVFNALFSLRMHTSVRDLGSGLNIFGKSVIEDAGVLHYADDLTFNIYLLLGMSERGMRIMYFPISWREDDQVSNVRMVSQALRTLALLWQSSAGRKAFFSSDHRVTRHAEYAFDVVYKSPEARP